MVIDHLSFNPFKAYAAAAYAIEQAKEYGLEQEVSDSFNQFLTAAFDSNDYPIDNEGYIAIANEALYEWDI